MRIWFQLAAGTFLSYAQNKFFYISTMPSPRISTSFPNDIYFLTCTVIEWIDIFTKPEYFRVLTDSLTFCQKQKGLIVYAYVFMTNHIHFIAQSNQSPLHAIIRDFKRHTTKEIKKLLLTDNRHYINTLLSHSYARKHGSDFQIWQRENFAEHIQSEAMMLSKVEYIHQNPVKKNYVIQPENWFYSSARFYTMNNEDLVKLHRLSGENIVVPGTTWN